MAWFKTDDNFADSKKVRAIPRARRGPALGQWVLAGTWCARHLTDGHVPASLIVDNGGKPADAKALADVGLWHTAGHDCTRCPQPETPTGYVFHDWADYQPTRAKVEAERQAARDRMARARAEREANAARRAAEQQQSSPEVRSNTDEPTAKFYNPEPEPEPVPYFSSSSGGESLETLQPGNAAPPAPPPSGICSRHPNGNPDDVPCRGCADARVSSEQYAEIFGQREKAEAAERRRVERERQAATERRTIDACPRCDHHGRTPAGHVCGHIPAHVGANGVAAARAGLAAARTAHAEAADLTETMT